MRIALKPPSLTDLVLGGGLDLVAQDGVREAQVSDILIAISTPARRV